MTELKKLEVVREMEKAIYKLEETMRREIEEIKREYLEEIQIIKNQKNELLYGEDERTQFEKRQEIIKKLNLTEFELKTTDTKRGQWVDERIKRHEFYIPYENDKYCTVYGEWYLTLKEKEELEIFTGKKFKDISEILEDNDLWVDWVDAK